MSQKVKKNQLTPEQIKVLIGDKDLKKLSGQIITKKDAASRDTKSKGR